MGLEEGSRRKVTIMLHMRGTEASSYGDGCGIKTGTDNTTQRESNSARLLSGLKAVKKGIVPGYELER